MNSAFKIGALAAALFAFPLFAEAGKTEGVAVGAGAGALVAGPVGAVVGGVVGYKVGGPNIVLGRPGQYAERLQGSSDLVRPSSELIKRAAAVPQR
jgi:osmotically inducible lipoprotein OsmB